MLALRRFVELDQTLLGRIDIQIRVTRSLLGQKHYKTKNVHIQQKPLAGSETYQGKESNGSCTEELTQYTKEHFHERDNYSGIIDPELVLIAIFYEKLYELQSMLDNIFYSHKVNYGS